MREYVPQELLERAFLGLSLYEWGVTLVLWVVCSVGLLALVRFVAWRVGKFAEATSNRVDDLVAEALRATRSYFLIALALLLAVQFVDLPEETLDWVGRIVFLVFLVQVIQWGNSLITFWVERYKEARLEEDATAVTTVQAIGFLGRLTLLTLVLLLALDNLGIEVTTLIAGLGIGGIAVGLALQNVLGDLFASLSIVIDKPFVVGDFLIIGEYLGSVEHVGLKTTRIRSLGGEQIVFSNSDLLNSRIRNYKRMSERRVVFTVGITYQTPHDKIKEVSRMLRESVEEQDEVRFDRAHFKAYGDYALIYEVVYYVLSPDYNVYMDKQEAINLAIHRRFEEAGIEFAYPTRTVYTREDASPGRPIMPEDTLEPADTESPQSTTE